MKTLLLSFLAALATAADTPSISGKWEVYTSISGNESKQSCTFTQKDDALTGSCVSDRGTVEISGNVKGVKVAWSYKSEYNGTPLTVNYDGSWEATPRIKGNVTVPEFGAAGDFTATPPK